MTKKLFILCLAVVWATTMMAQNIAVVSPEGETSLYKTMNDAIDGAEAGSVVYLPGGVFQIDKIHINKKITIIGTGHKISSENPDGITTISGYLYFDAGSDGSAMIGCYLTYALSIANSDNEVNDILVRHCNLNEVNVNNNKCVGITINQNYIREGVKSGTAPVTLTNNITGYIHNVYDGEISNNIITSTSYYTTGCWYSIASCARTIITNNIILNSNATDSNSRTIQLEGNNLVSSNMTITDWGDDCINVGNVDWHDVFVNYVGNTSSDFHFKEAYKQYENQVGVYADGVDFDKQLAPVPYIVAKHIEEQTDAQGKLSIKIRVKAGNAE